MVAVATSPVAEAPIALTAAVTVMLLIQIQVTQQAIIYYGNLFFGLSLSFEMFALIWSE